MPFEMKGLMHIVCFSWPEKKTNVLEKAGVNRATARYRKLSFYGHVKRNKESAWIKKSYNAHYPDAVEED